MAWGLGDTAAAMLEAERLAHDTSVKRYSDVEEAARQILRAVLDGASGIQTLLLAIRQAQNIV